jgi:SynChlorMet cassette protein ScmC
VVQNPGKEPFLSLPFEQLPNNLKAKLPKHGWLKQTQKQSQSWIHPKSNTIILELFKPDSYAMKIIHMWTLLDNIYGKIIESGGFPMHAALLKKGNRGIIIAAHGGTGKSTCYRRAQSPWKGLCDDEVLIIRDKRGRCFAHPCPTWSNHIMRRHKKGWRIEQTVQLAAFCFLKQAKKDRITFIGQGQAAILINQHALQVAYRNFSKLPPPAEKEARHQLFENACRAAKTLPAYILETHKSGKFWEEIDKILT